MSTDNLSHKISYEFVLGNGNFRSNADNGLSFGQGTKYNGYAKPPFCDLFINDKINSATS